jgi:hypothetical protein
MAHMLSEALTQFIENNDLAQFDNPPSGLEGKLILATALLEHADSTLAFNEELE